MFNLTESPIDAAALRQTLLDNENVVRLPALKVGYAVKTMVTVLNI